ncbi:MAG: rRNA maturation RNase YbeY [Chloroherpetonaceae bacterium]|jgi:rRNA maturation RNase YbeY|nr:rRNA maturation RNase YbeY [bacterium]
MSNTINIFNSTEKRYLPLKKIEDIANEIFKEYQINNANLNIIFLSDAEIQKINKQFLDHNYTTDVISFNFDEKDLEGEVYISIDTAERQAIEYKVSLTNEVLRLTAHGILHLLGYEDDTVDKKEKMHNLEEKFLQKI